MPTLNLYCTLSSKLSVFGAVTVPKTEWSVYEHLARGKSDSIYFSKCVFEELISLMSVCEISF